MILWHAKQNVPKPVPAPPQAAPPKPLRSYGHWEEPVPEKFAEGPEWPHAWGGPPDVRGPHEQAGGEREVEQTRDAPATGRDARSGREEGARRSSRSSRDGHRVHQQKLKSSASRDRRGECERAKEGKGRTGRQGVEGARERVYAAFSPRRD